jgi:hypothetical protein
MLPGDARSEWDRSIFDDPRGVNLWDAHGVLGERLGRRGGLTGAEYGSVVWDAFFVFGGDSGADRVRDSGDRRNREALVGGLAGSRGSARLIDPGAPGGGKMAA